MIEDNDSPKGFAGLSQLVNKGREDRAGDLKREAESAPGTPPPPQRARPQQPQPKPHPQPQPQPSERQQTTPGYVKAPSGGDNVLKVGVIALIVVIAGGIWSQAPDSNPPADRTAPPVSGPPRESAPKVAPRPAAPVPVGAYVTSLNANVRSGPGTSFGVIGSLPQMSRVQVLGDEGSWSTVRVELLGRPADGYMHHSVLRKGTYADARAVVCDVQNSGRPRSGEVLLQRRRGDHHLTVNAGQNDVLVKVRQGATTVLSYYVRGGESGTVRTVPEGRYQVMFATGDGFSRKCLEFVRSMQVLSDPSPQTFETTSDGFYSYLTTSEYTLTTQTGGNFRPQTVDASAFREDNQ